MALKVIMLRHNIERLKKDLEMLREKDAEFQTREAELEKAIPEAETDEQREAVQGEVEAFEGEKAEHENKKADLTREIEDLEAELAEEERKIPQPAHPKKKDERSYKVMNINIRSLPMNQRAMDALPMETREAIMQRDDVKAFLAEMRSMKGQKRAVTGGELTIPVVFLDLIAENMYRYSKLMNRVRVRNVSGEARQTIAGTVPEAVWTEMCGAINELTFVFNQVTLDGYKVAGFIPVCNSLLEDSDIALASWIVEMMSEALGLAKDKAIIYGKGASAKMPLGIVTRLAQSSKPSGYPQNAPDWVDLHTSNILKINGDSLTGAAFWAALTVAEGNTFTKYSRGRKFWAMNSKTYAYLTSKAITFTASGEIVANIFGTLPVINGDIDILEFMPDYDIVGGYGDLYVWAQRAGMTIEASREVQFIQDNTVFKAKERADGEPVIPGAFVAINIKNQDVTTTMAFAADTANDADLASLTGLTLSPSFDADTLTYTATTTNASDAVTALAANTAADVVIEVAKNNGGTITKSQVVNGAAITWQAGANNVLTVTVKNGNATKVYTVTVTKN